MKQKSLIQRTDSYKFSHWLQYPKNTTKVHSYIESRGGDYSFTLFAGLQPIMEKYLLNPFPNGMEDIEYMRERTEKHGVPFHYEGFKRLYEKHGNKLPLVIKAVPEGTVVPTLNVLVTVENTDPEFFWLTSFVETLLLKVWYPITVATISKSCKNIIKKFLEDTAENSNSLPFKLHDFGQRGVSSEESSEFGGFAHLINFMGTDTFNGIEFCKEYYDEDMAGFSIPASEHSTITSWGKENEFEAYANMVEQYKDSEIFACVSDSYNIYEAIKMWGSLKDKLKENGTTLVVRPDSGDPVSMSCECVELLAEEFGYTTNLKGYKELDGVRVIYGDGISNPDVIRRILKNLKDNGFSAENMAFGMGGGLLQKCDRDTLKFAMKCSAMVADGKVIPVYKNPITDKHKVSKKGFQDLQKDLKGNFITVPSMHDGEPMGSCLVEVFRDGEIKKRYTLKEIRENSNK